MSEEDDVSIPEAHGSIKPSESFSLEELANGE